VSIIITAGRYNHNLVESINTCLRLDYPDFEILVLPDEPFEYTGAERVKVIPTGKRNPGHKRNLGSREATGEILAFLDDEAYPLADWLTNAARNFSMPEVAAVGGPALTAPVDNLRQQASGEIYSSKIVSGPYTYRYIPGRFRQVKDYPAHNLLVRKKVFDKLGGFPTEYWPGEDSVFCRKIIRELKLKIVYEPDAIVFHHRKELYRAHLKQIGSYALHRGFFIRRFPETGFLPAYFAPSILVFVLALGWAATFFWPSLGTVYLVGVLAYIVSAFLTAALSLDPRQIWLVFSGIVLSHLTCGVYFIKGLLSRRLD
jgi:GT2 family glycosyltransferase